MGSKSDIQWTQSTWTPIRARVKHEAVKIARAKGYTSLVRIAEKMVGHVGPHCEHASPGCDNCYSETNNHRCLPANGTGLPFDRRSRDLVDVFIDEAIFNQPLHWKQPRKIFVCSQTDLFGDWVPDGFIGRMFGLMASAHWHVFQVLTKHADRLYEWSKAVMHYPHGDRSQNPVYGWPPNVWLGVSAEDQRRADERIPLLLKTPAAVRFISAEPLLGPLSFRWAAWDDGSPNSSRRNQVAPVIRGGKVLSGSIDHLDGLRMLDWVIVGAEAGPGARPFSLEWLRKIISECREAGVPCFIKQVGRSPRVTEIDTQSAQYMRMHDRNGGDWDEWPTELRIREFPAA